MRHFIALTLSFALASSIAQASRVGIGSSATGRTVYDASLNALPDGDLFFIGTFSNPGAISLSLGSLAAIESAGGWSQFAPSQALTTSTILSTHPGKLLGTPLDDTATATPFNNLQIYIIVLNSSIAANATQIGIFTNTSATTGSPWFFPVNANGLGDDINIKMDDANAIAVNGVGSTTVTPQGFVLSVMVPEPASAGLLAFGVCGLVGYRRMRRLG